MILRSCLHRRCKLLLHHDPYHLPMAKPSIITIILFNFLSFWNEYIISMTLMSFTSAPRTLPVGLLI